jgi:hypothetical protein
MAGEGGMGGMGGMAGEGGMGGMAGEGGMGGMAGEGGMGGMAGMGGVGGMAGMGGMAGEGGTGGMAGEGGMGGMAGMGGVGGMAGEGGMGGVGGSIDPCDGGLGPCDPTGASACVDEGGGAYSCVCNLGYAGMDCDACDDGYVDDPMSPGECIADPCGGDPCGIGGGNGASCTVDGPGAYTCTCDGNFDPDDDCGSCLAPFDGINCQCDTSMGEIPDGMGGCTTCTPTPGIVVTLPTSGAPTPTYTDMSNGFTISAANCDMLPLCDVTFSFYGVGANANGSASAMEMNDVLVIEFFDAMGVPSLASNVALILNSAGDPGNIVVAVDGGAPVMESAIPGAAIPLSSSSAHKIEVSVPDLDTARLYWAELDYDHDCL